jgi:hypothetical protein
MPVRIGFVLAVGVCLIALPTAAAAPSETARVAANSATFQDSTGEDPTAPDITSIIVSNDDAGIVSFRVNVPNRPTLGQDMLFEIWVDTDNNAATGSPDLGGADYVMQLVRGEISLYKWDGADYTRRFGDPSAVTMNFSYQAGLTARISAAELGNTKAFKFFVVAISGLVVDPVTGDLDGANSKADVAPGGGVGLFPFTVTIAKPTLVVRRLTTTPRAPKAGQTFTMRMTTARSDSGAVLQNGRVTCVARAGTTRLQAQLARVQGGAVVCTWLIPANAKGKTFRGSAAVVFEGLRVSRSFSRRIA